MNLFSVKRESSEKKDDRFVCISGSFYLNIVLLDRCCDNDNR